MKNFFARNYKVSIVLFDQAVVSGVNFLTGLLFARFLGIEEFGRFTLAWMVVLFVNSLQMALVSSPMMAIGPKQHSDKIDFYYTSVLAQQMIFGLLSFAFAYIFAKMVGLLFQNWKIADIALPLASVAFFFQNQDFLRRYFFSKDSFNSALVIDLISYMGQLLILIVLFWKFNLVTSSVLWVIAVTSAASIFFALKMRDEIKWSLQNFFDTARRHWHFSKWVTASAILHWSSSNLFFVVTGGVLGVSAVGAMKASQNIMGIASIVFQGFENIVPVSASKMLCRSGKKGMLLYLKKVTLFGGALLSCFSFVVALVPELLLGSLFGAEYREFGYVLRWFSFIYLFMFLGFPLRAGLRSLEYTRPIFLSYLLATIFTVSMSNYLVGRFALHGSMFGLFIVYFLLAIVPFDALMKCEYNPTNT